MSDCRPTIPEGIIEETNRRYRYDSATGIISSKIPIPHAGPPGYVIRDSIKVRGIKMQRNQLAWVLHYGEWPASLIDHKDGDKDNNRISNLRKATHRQNQQNKVMPNKWGKKGVFLIRSRLNPFAAIIRVDGKQVYLGCYPTIDEAHEAYCAAALKYHGEFACTESYR